MTIISENTNLLLSLLIIIISIIICSVVSYHRSKVDESKQLQLIFSEIEIEKKTQNSLKNVSKKIDDLKQKTKASFLKINVEIINIDFSYKEVIAKIN